MATIAGLRGTGDWSGNQRPTNFREVILWEEPNGDTPFTALLSKMGKESTDDPKYTWFEEHLDHVRLRVNGALDDNPATTTVVVDAENALIGQAKLFGAIRLVPGDLLLVEDDEFDGEVIQVATVVSDTQFTCTRAAAGTTIAAIANDAYLLKIGNAFAEGSGSPTTSTRNPDEKYNYVQIFKTAYEITETAKKTKVRTGDELKNDKKRKMFDHARDLELAFLFGRRHQATGANGKPLRYTGGVQEFITTHKTKFGAGGVAWTLDNLLVELAKPFDYRGAGAGDERIAFVGNGALTAINKLVKDSTNSRINWDGHVSVYGMNLRKLIIPQGVIYFKTHPLMNRHPVLTNSLMQLNPKAIKYRYLRDTFPKNNVQGNDEDTEKGMWITEAGVEVQHEQTMQILHKLGG